jgi:hypothetical protein
LARETSSHREQHEMLPNEKRDAGSPSTCKQATTFSGGESAVKSQKQLTSAPPCKYSKGGPPNEGLFVLQEGEPSIAFHVRHERVACEPSTAERGQSVNFFDNVRQKTAKLRWEYCELIYIGSAEEEYRLNFYATEQAHNYALKANERGRTIARLGQEGWELIASSVHGSHEALYFKRPLP